jgi:hypothetical protein
MVPDCRAQQVAILIAEKYDNPIVTPPEDGVGRHRDAMDLGWAILDSNQ